jgi:5-methylcytosine-specific restriction enzyme subunit McrC
VLDEVDDARLTGGEIDRLVFDRRAERYRSAIGWARAILALLAPSLRGGQHEAPALLFDMNRLFESSVANVLRRSALRHGLEVVTQDRSRALATIVSGDVVEPAFALRPDLLIMQQDRVVVIADTKWKQLERDRMSRPSPSEADMYQLHAYASAFQCHELALIFPWTAPDRVMEATFRLPAQDAGATTVHVVGIDVGDDAMPLRIGRGPAELVQLFER